MAYAAQLQKHTSPFGQLIASPPGLTAKDSTWVSFCWLDLAYRMNNELSALQSPQKQKNSIGECSEDLLQKPLKSEDSHSRYWTENKQIHWHDTSGGR